MGGGANCAGHGWPPCTAINAGSMRRHICNLICTRLVTALIIATPAGPLRPSGDWATERYCGMSDQCGSEIIGQMCSWPSSTKLGNPPLASVATGSTGGGPMPRINISFSLSTRMLFASSGWYVGSSRPVAMSVRICFGSRMRLCCSINSANDMRPACVRISGLIASTTTRSTPSMSFDCHSLSAHEFALPAMMAVRGALANFLSNLSNPVRVASISRWYDDWSRE